MSSNNKEGGDLIKAIKAEILDLTEALETDLPPKIWDEKFNELEKLESDLRDLGGGQETDAWKCDS